MAKPDGGMVGSNASSWFLKRRTRSSDPRTKGIELFLKKLRYIDPVYPIMNRDKK